MKLFGSSVSPFVRKVLIYAAERGLSLENIPVSPHQDEAGFRGVSPVGKIPALQDGEYSLADSSAIIHYLEAKYPNGGLIPADPELRGTAIWYEEFADTELYKLITVIFVNRALLPKLMKVPGDEEKAAEAEKQLPPLLHYLERVVPMEGYLVGSSLSLADIAVATQIINLGHGGVQLDADVHPKLAAWFGRISSRPSVSALITAERGMLAM